MKLISKKKFIVQLKRAFLQEPLITIFIISIIGGIFAHLWLPYDVTKPYKGIGVSSFLMFLCIMVPKPYDVETLKRDISYFISLHYCRREYFRNKIIIVNLFISFSVIFYTCIMFIMVDCNMFEYLGFTMEKNFISFLKVSFINMILYNLFYTFILIVEILFIKFVPNKIRNLILGVIWAIASLIFVSGIYIKIIEPNIILACYMVFIFIAYYAYYKFIMNLDF